MTSLASAFVRGISARAVEITDLNFAAFCGQPPDGKSSRFRNYTHSEPRFRAFLNQDEIRQLEVVRA
jgi:hypothetical protein